MKCKICKKLCKFVIVLVAIIFICIQFVPVENTNPPVTGEINAPPEVLAILQRSCYDCHSNETVWPWYSDVAPMSWLVEKDVIRGRKHVNFSTWTEYSAKKQNHSRKEIGEVVAEGEMPLWFYLPLHPSAKLTKEDVATIVTWSSAGLGNNATSGFIDDDHDHDH